MPKNEWKNEKKHVRFRGKRCVEVLGSRFYTRELLVALFFYSWLWIFFYYVPWYFHLFRLTLIRR